MNGSAEWKSISMMIGYRFTNHVTQDALCANGLRARSIVHDSSTHTNWTCKMHFKIEFI